MDKLITPGAAPAVGRAIGLILGAGIGNVGAGPILGVSDEVATGKRRDLDVR
jgi:hypothetical protein